MSQASCLYEGVVRHRRHDPPKAFRHRVALAYVDLQELPSLLGGRLASPRRGPVRFRRSDYLGDPALPLDQAVRDMVERQIGERPAGRIRVLTHLRSFGHCFNPVSFYYCVDDANQRLEAVVAEVTNTPWGERHAYVIRGGRGEFAKALHVSPFMGMDHRYVCDTGLPGPGLAVKIQSRRGERSVFQADLNLRRQELTEQSLRRITLRYPAATVRVLGLIYLHALGLRLAGAPVFQHPERTA